MKFCPAGLQCLLALQSGDKETFVSGVQHLVFSMIQLTLYCWAGQNLQTCYDNLAISFYASHWYNAGPKLFKNMVFAVMKGNRSLTLRVGKVANANLEQYAKIWKSSMSTFSILRVVIE